MVSRRASSEWLKITLLTPTSTRSAINNSTITPATTPNADASPPKVAPPTVRTPQHRQEDRHSKIFDHRDRDNEASFGRSVQAEVSQHLRSDTRRADKRDAAQEQRGNQSPTQHESRYEARHEIQEDIYHTGARGLLQRVYELGGGVLETEHEKQQDEPDLAPGVDELLSGDERERATFAECQAGEEVEGDRGDPKPIRDARDHGQPDEDRTELQESLSHIQPRGSPRAPNHS